MVLRPRRISPELIDVAGFVVAYTPFAVFWSVVECKRQHESAVTRLSSLGAKFYGIEYDPTAELTLGEWMAETLQDGGGIISILEDGRRRRPPRPSYADVVQLGEFADIGSISLHQGRELKPDDVRFLALFPNLNALNLRGSRIGGEGLQQLPSCRALRALDLSRCGISDEGMAVFTELVELRHLVLSDNPIGEAGMASLRNCQKLERLVLSGANITEKGKQELRRLLPNTKIQF